MTTKPKTAKGAAAAALDAKGIDWVCAEIENGQMLTTIAGSMGLSLHALTAWLASDQGRSARARDARLLSAAAFEEKAEICIAESADQFGLAKAKELAHHYRWKASKLDPRRYGDKVELEHKGRIAVAREMTDDELAAIAASSGQ